MHVSRGVCLLAVCAPLALLAQAAGGRFDGNWSTNMSCDASTHMPAYTWTFQSVDYEAELSTASMAKRAGRGTWSWMGRLVPTARRKLHVKGKVSAGKAGLVTQLKGNKYDYYVDAKFTGASGTGKREEGAGILGRPCSFEFTKQTDTGAPAAAPAPAIPSSSQ